MSDDINLNVEFGPLYEVVICPETSEPMRLNVGFAGSGETTATASGTLDVRVTAQEVVGAYRAIGYDGLYTTDTTESLALYAGITRVATIIGDAVNVVRIGFITEDNWNWTVNQPVFISGQGVLTQSVPTGVLRRIGWAISPTKLNLDPYPIIGV